MLSFGMEQLDITDVVSLLKSKAKQKVLAVDALPTNTEEWSTYEVPEEVLQVFRHELMVTSVGISSQTIVKPASCFGTVFIHVTCESMVIY